MAYDHGSITAPTDGHCTNGGRLDTSAFGVSASAVFYRKVSGGLRDLAGLVGRAGVPKRDSRQRSGRAGRLLDRHVGRALIRVAGLTRRAARQPEQPGRIAVCILGAIGDALIAGALAQDLHDAYPKAEIIFVVTASNRHIVPLLPGVHGMLVISPTRPDVAMRAIRRSRFDIFIDCNQWLRISALHAALAGCFTVGFRTAGQHRHHAYDQAVDHLATRHELDNFRALLVPLGVVGRAVPKVMIPDAAHAAVASLLAEHAVRHGRQGMVVFHPWASGVSAELKEWPTVSWVALAGALAERGYTVCVTGAGGDLVKAGRLVAAAAERGVEIRSAAGSLSLTEVAALLQAAEAVVSVNTGIMHIAAAAGSPLVALHGPTNPDRWGPLSESAAVVVPKGVPSGYLHLGFEYPKDSQDCMSAISVDAVLDAVLQTLTRAAAARKRQPTLARRARLGADNL